VPRYDGNGIPEGGTRPFNWRHGCVSPYESIWSIAQKFTFLNRTGFRQFSAFVGGAGASRGSPRTLEGIPVERVRDALGLESVCFAACPVNMLMPLPLRALPIRRVLRLCPDCAQRGYHSAIHQLPWLTRCPIHGCELITRCKRCGTPWLYDGGQNSGMTAVRNLCCSCGLSLLPMPAKWTVAQSEWRDRKRVGDAAVAWANATCTALPVFGPIDQTNEDNDTTLEYATRLAKIRSPPAVLQHAWNAQRWRVRIAYLKCSEQCAKEISSAFRDHGSGALLTAYLTWAAMNRQEMPGFERLRSLMTAWRLPATPPSFAEELVTQLQWCVQTPPTSSALSLMHLAQHHRTGPDSLATISAQLFAIELADQLWRSGLLNSTRDIIDGPPSRTLNQATLRSRVRRCAFLENYRMNSTLVRLLAFAARLDLSVAAVSYRRVVATNGKLMAVTSAYVAPRLYIGTWKQGRLAVEVCVKGAVHVSPGSTFL
jgi:hypothetical protein